MITKEALRYRAIVTLRDGVRVLLHPLTADDQQKLVDLFAPVPYDERRFMRHNINDPELVSGWALNPDYDKVFPLVAEVGDRIVGNATLHFGQGPSRHAAEMRIFLAKDFRGRGLGDKMVQSMIDIARQRKLHHLEVQIVSTMGPVLKAMQKAGFETICVFEDYFMLPDGDLRDVVMLILNLQPKLDEF